MSDNPEEDFLEYFIDDLEKNAENYEYPDAAPPEAPEEVKEAIRRWREEVPEDQKERQPLLYWLLGTGTPAYKMSQEDANVKHEPQNGQKCGNCEYAYYPNDKDYIICSQVRDKFKENDWCKLWEANKDE